MFVTIFWTTFIPNTMFLQFFIEFCHSEHPVFFLMSGNRNEHLLQKTVMKKWCEMSVPRISYVCKKENENMRGIYRGMVVHWKQYWWGTKPKEIS